MLKICSFYTRYQLCYKDHIIIVISLSHLSKTIERKWRGGDIYFKKNS